MTNIEAWGKTPMVEAKISMWDEWGKILGYIKSLNSDGETYDADQVMMLEEPLSINQLITINMTIGDHSYDAKARVIDPGDKLEVDASYHIYDRVKMTILCPCGESSLMESHTDKCLVYQIRR